jgi:hypothetical protein
LSSPGLLQMSAFIMNTYWDSIYCFSSNIKRSDRNWANEAKKRRYSHIAFKIFRSVEFDAIHSGDQKMHDEPRQ